MTVVFTKRIVGNWRVIVRFSLDYDKSSAVRNAIAPVNQPGSVAPRRAHGNRSWRTAVPPMLRSNYALCSVSWNTRKPRLAERDLTRCSITCGCTSTASS